MKIIEIDSADSFYVIDDNNNKIGKITLEHYKEYSSIHDFNIYPQYRQKATLDEVCKNIASLIVFYNREFRFIDMRFEHDLWVKEIYDSLGKVGFVFKDYFMVKEV